MGAATPDVQQQAARVQDMNYQITSVMEEYHQDGPTTFCYLLVLHLKSLLRPKRKDLSHFLPVKISNTIRS